jgi:predicted metal-dependent HD superfamily phosphohydrolase
MIDALRERWIAFWNASRAAGDPLPAWRDLERRYSEPHRRYHVLDHVAHCLEELDGVRAFARDDVAVELALWFHDAVYDTRASDNEERSAALAETCALDMLLSSSTRGALRPLILATRHDAETPTGDAGIVVDCDLAILGQPAARFDAYERAIRAEYAWVPAPVFAAKRREILLALLQRPHLYATDPFRARYEAAARENLRRSLGDVA